MTVTELYEALGQYHGSIQMITNRSGFSRETVRKVLKGETVNADIILVATAVLAELRDQRSRQEDATRQALNTIK